MNDYHAYIIKDGCFIGNFEAMYRECDDPWKSKDENYSDSACSVMTKALVQPPVLSIGSGLGRHMQWLDCPVTGIELSETAALRSAQRYPWCPVIIGHAVDYLSAIKDQFNTYLFREVLWYLLPEWAPICDILKTKHGALVIVELSFYDDQQYGKDYFDGPDEFIRKYPFPIQKIVREHSTVQQREGRVMVAGRVP